MQHKVIKLYWKFSPFMQGGEVVKVGEIKYLGWTVQSKAAGRVERVEMSVRGGCFGRFNLFNLLCFFSFKGDSGTFASFILLVNKNLCFIHLPTCLSFSIWTCFVIFLTSLGLLGNVTRSNSKREGLDDLETVAMAGSGARGDDKLFIASDHNEQD